MEIPTSAPYGLQLKALSPQPPAVSQWSDSNFHGIYSSHLTVTSGSSRPRVLPAAMEAGICSVLQYKFNKYFL